MDFYDYVVGGLVAIVAAVSGLVALWKRRSRFLEELEFPSSKKRAMFRQERIRQSAQVEDLAQARKKAGLDVAESEQRLAESRVRRQHWDEGE